MQTIICDSCRKQVKDAMRAFNYFTFKEKAMCVPCKEDFDTKVTRIMRTKRKYSFADYKKVYNDTLNKVCK